ncbi:hypothetical protein B4113_0403 [Geobacillus sp. B4113_201601]|nr:hypothetical protein B4113_0403 [Geobacillus sp. B4113_201601]
MRDKRRNGRQYLSVLRGQKGFLFALAWALGVNSPLRLLARARSAAGLAPAGEREAHGKKGR